MRNKELHDIYPQKNYKKSVIRLAFIWLLLTILELILFSLMDWPSVAWEISGWILFLFVFLVPFCLIIFIDMAKVLTLWDDIDYKSLELIKTDLEFTTSDGFHPHAYFFTKKGVDIDTDLSPRPAIIGFHGLNSHHREMDRYCLPTVVEQNYLYFTYDARGHGQSKGSRNDFGQFSEAKEFIDYVASLPFVDKKRIAVVGMSLGANKAAVAAYPHLDVKLIFMLSGPFNLTLTRDKMGRFERLGMKLARIKLAPREEDMETYSGMHFFNPEGIILRGQTKPTPNKDRVFLIAAADDFTVHSDNTREAAQKLQLPPENYHIFTRGAHNFTGSEWFVSVKIFKFLSERL